MKNILLSFLFIFLLTSCTSSTYQVISDEPVDGYYIYHKESKGLFCNTYWEDIFYSGKTYNYGYRHKGCNANMAYFIKISNAEYIYLGYALDENIITLDSLIPELMELDRDPEEIKYDEADYYWLDFHISGNVVYAYAGGECDQNGSETFVIENITYTYSANGCLKENILFMRFDGINIPVATLLSNGTINGEYLIPLLTEKID